MFVPGGDPGHTEPRYLMALLEKQTANLKKYHPKATMWVSPQGFNAPWMEQFFGLMDQQPQWLSGIVFGPQVRVNLPELRQRIPKRYPIRFYPDITHSRERGVRGERLGRGVRADRGARRRSTRGRWMRRRFSACCSRSPTRAS